MTWKNQLAPLSHFLSPALSMAPNFIYVFIRLSFFPSPSFEVGAKSAQDPLFSKSSLYVEIPIQRFEKWANFCAPTER